MKILLDECVDRRLAQEIEGHEVVTVPQAGWAGVRNGDLLRRAQDQFDVLVTVDRNLSFQQPLSQFTITVIVLQAPTNQLKDLRPLVPQLQRILPSAPKGQVSRVGGQLYPVVQKMVVLERITCSIYPSFMVTSENGQNLAAG